MGFELVQGLLIDSVTDVLLTSFETIHKGIDLTRIDHNLGGIPQLRVSQLSYLLRAPSIMYPKGLADVCCLVTLPYEVLAESQHWQSFLDELGGTTVVGVV